MCRSGNQHLYASQAQDLCAYAAQLLVQSLFPFYLGRYSAVALHSRASRKSTLTCRAGSDKWQTDSHRYSSFGYLHSKCAISSTTRQAGRRAAASLGGFMQSMPLSPHLWSCFWDRGRRNTPLQDLHKFDMPFERPLMLIILGSSTTLSRNITTVRLSESGVSSASAPRSRPETPTKRGPPTSNWRIEGTSWRGTLDQLFSIRLGQVRCCSDTDHPPACTRLLASKLPRLFLFF